MRMMRSLVVTSVALLPVNLQTQSVRKPLQTHLQKELEDKSEVYTWYKQIYLGVSCRKEHHGELIMIISFTAYAI